MKNDSLVSIVIPVYNTAEYLNECVKSCAGQTYRNCEVILVDDGSTDNSGAICEELSNTFGNVFAYHKVNGGLSDARNYGVKKCNGEYIMFVDADDVVGRSIVEYLLDLLLKYESEVSICGLKHFKDGETPDFEVSGGDERITSENAIVELLYQKRISTSACARLYKRNLISQCSFIKGQLFEDNLYSFDILQKADGIALGDACLYGYRHREKSITTKPFSRKDFDIINIGKEIINKAKNMPDSVQKAAVAYQNSNAMRIYLTAKEEYFSDDEYKYCIDFLTNNMRQTILDSDARFKLRVSLFLFGVHFPRKIMCLIRNGRGRWN